CSFASRCSPFLRDQGSVGLLRCVIKFDVSRKMLKYLAGNIDGFHMAECGGVVGSDVAEVGLRIQCAHFKFDEPQASQGCALNWGDLGNPEIQCFAVLCKQNWCDRDRL